MDDLSDPQRPMLDDTATVDALAFYVDLFTRYGVAPGGDFMGRNYGAASRQVAQAGGHCGLWIGLFSDRAKLAQIRGSMPGRCYQRQARSQTSVSRSLRATLSHGRRAIVKRHWSLRAF